MAKQRGKPVKTDFSGRFDLGARHCIEQQGIEVQRKARKEKVTRQTSGNGRFSGRFLTTTSPVFIGLF